MKFQVLDIPDPTVKGAKHADTYRASVFAIMQERTPRVIARGLEFSHKNRWTARRLVSEICQWSKANPGKTPQTQDIREWVKTSNALKVKNPEILIAALVEDIPLRIALGLTGGAYHEAFHGVYTCQRNITVEEVCDIINPRWGLIPNGDWSPYYMLLQDWNNIVEDIRIERNGRRDYPGTDVKLHDLQDFILGQETVARAKKKENRKNTLSIVMSVFRDVGLGYHTMLQSAALDTYRALDPAAVAFVLEGPLAPYLREAIALRGDDDLGCIRLAFDIVAKIVQAGRQESEKKEGEGEGDEKEGAEKEGEEGSGESAYQCPKCGAGADKITVHQTADPGRGIQTCMACGWQHECVIHESPNLTGEGIRLRGADVDLGGDPDDEGSESSGTGAKEEKEGGEGEEKEGGEGGSGKGGGEEGSESGAGKKEGGEKGNGTGPGVGAGAGDGDAESGETRQPVPGAAGGHHYDPDPVKGNNFDFRSVAADVLQSPDRGDMLDGGSALHAAFEAVQTKADRDLKPGEQPWRPYDPSLDDVILVKPSKLGRDHDLRQASSLLESVKQESSFLRARMRNIIRAMEMTNVVHGIQKGRHLSVRFLVDSKVSLMSGTPPKRAYMKKDEKIDTSMAAVVVIDESGSMAGQLKDATRVLCALVEPLDAVGAKVMAAGFRDGRPNRTVFTQGKVSYHRVNGIVHDVFKTFDERFAAVKWRFANTRATGGTPMADGVQFGLDSLSARKEAHRFLFVVTDGAPNLGHEEVIRRQIRIAGEAGIHVVGVGIGQHSAFVQHLFPDHVWSSGVKDLPKALIKKLNSLVDLRAPQRGRRVRSTQ